MIKLHYLFRRTSRTEPSKATIVVLHGYGANEFDLLGLADYFPEPLTVISLRAPLTLDWGGFAWYHLSQGATGLIADDDSRLESEELLYRQLPDILRDAEANGPVFLMGFSQGAAMCYGLVVNRDLGALGIDLRGLIAMSGYMPNDVLGRIESQRLDGFPIMITHGELDELIVPRALDVARDALTAAGASVTARKYPVGHTISEPGIRDITAWLSDQLQNL